MPIRPTLTILASLLAGLLAIPPGALAAADEKLLAAARAAQPAVIESLKAMVAIESGTMDLPGLGKMTDYAEARLKALGLQVERRPASTASTGNMSLGTLKGWLNTPRNGGVAVSMPSSLPQSRPAQQWSAAERLLALHESHGLHGAALHAWCREKGVFEHQLVCWRDAFCASPEPQSAEAARTAKVELKALQSQHVVGVNYLGRIRRVWRRDLPAAAAHGAQPTGVWDRVEPMQQHQSREPTPALACDETHRPVKFGTRRVVKPRHRRSELRHTGDVLALQGRPKGRLQIVRTTRGWLHASRDERANRQACRFFSPSSQG